MGFLSAKAFGILGAGLLTSLTPCVYPMIPITLGYLGTDAKSKSLKKIRVLGFFYGQVIMFTALGILAVSLGEVFGFSSEMVEVQYFTGALLLIFGIGAMYGKMPAFLNKWNQLKVFNSTNQLNQTRPLYSFIQAFIVGAVTSLIASPCASPILGGVLSQIASEDSLFSGAFLMLLYSLGLSSIFLLLGLGLINADKLPKSGNWLTYIHKISAYLLIGVGAYYIAVAAGVF